MTTDHPTSAASETTPVEVPAPGNEERDFWLEAAVHHGFEETTGGEHLAEYDPPAYFATEDEVISLMAACREQGRKDALATPTGAGMETREAFDAAAEARDAAGFIGTPAQCIQWLSEENDRLRAALAPATPARAVDGETHELPDEPSAEMLKAASNWFRGKYGEPVSHEAARGIWQMMLWTAQSALAARTPAGAAGDPVGECPARWEDGFRSIVTVLKGARSEFTIPEIVEAVRALAARPTSPAPTSSPESTLSAAPETPTAGGGERDLTNWRCPECHCHSFARVQERKADQTFGPGPMIRCVNCKRVESATPSPATAGDGDLREALKQIIALAPEADPGSPFLEFGGYRSQGNAGDLIEDGRQHALWEAAYIARAALARPQPAVDVPADRERIIDIIRSGYRSGFDVRHMADAILATRPTEPGGARGESQATRPDELTRDEARRRAIRMFADKGWKATDRLSVHSIAELMTSFGLSLLADPPQDRCAYPDCGCDHDARCSAASTASSAEGGKV